MTLRYDTPKQGEYGSDTLFGTVHDSVESPEEKLSKAREDIKKLLLKAQDASDASKKRGLRDTTRQKLFADAGDQRQKADALIEEWFLTPEEREQDEIEKGDRIVQIRYQLRMEASQEWADQRRINAEFGRVATGSGWQADQEKPYDNNDFDARKRAAGEYLHP